MIIKSLSRHEKGLTLVELLVALAIISLVLATLYSFYSAGLNSWNRAVSRVEAAQSARIALDRMIRELRYADQVWLTENEGEIRFTAPHDPYRTLRFRLVGNELVYDSYPTGSPYYFNTKIALELQTIRFTAGPENLVLIEITAGDPAAPLRLSGAVYPRNQPDNYGELIQPEPDHTSAELPVVQQTGGNQDD